MNSVGLDAHKTRCVACVKTPEGRILEEFAFQNNPHGHEELIAHQRAYPQVQVAIESTGNLWIPIYNRLEDEHIHTVLTNPKKTRLIAEAKIKTDRLDARILADLLRANLLSASYVPPPEIRMQRSIIRERARLTQLRTIIKNRIHSFLDKHGYKSPYTDLFGKHGLEWLSKLELPADDRILLEVNLEQLSSLNHSIHRLNETIATSAIENPEVKLLMGFTGIDYRQRHAPHQRDWPDSQIPVTEEACQLRRPRTQHTPIRQPHNSWSDHEERQQPHTLDTRRSRPARVTTRPQTRPVLPANHETSRTQQSPRRSRPQDACHDLPCPQPSPRIPRSTT